MDPFEWHIGPIRHQNKSVRMDQRATGIQGLFLNRVSVAERTQKTWLYDDLSGLQGQKATEATHSPEAVSNWARQGPETGVMT